MNKRIFIYGSALLALCACSHAPQAVVYDTIVVERGDITNSVTSTGTVEPVNSVDVGTQVSGIIEKIYVDYNSVVKEGQVIAELDRTTLEAELKSSKANLASCQAELTYQTANYRRIKALYDSAVVSDSDMETAQYQYDKAVAAMQRAEADHSRVLKNLSYATIYSPISGVVLDRAVEEGQTVAASFNTPTLFTIAQDLKKMRVIADVDEADIGQVKAEQSVQFTVDAFPNEVFYGTVQQVRLKAKTTSNVVTYEVVINAPNEELKLKPGLTASITIITQHVSDVPVIPVKALTFEPENTPLSKEEASSPSQPITGDHVYVMREGRPVAMQVELGMTNGIKSEILSGLQVGDSVVVDQSNGIPTLASQQQGAPLFGPGPRKGNKK